MTEQHPFAHQLAFNSDYGREIQDEARAEQIEADARIWTELHVAIKENRWPDLKADQCRRLIELLENDA